MPGLGGALNIASWTMYYSQLALEIASHNVSNANTDGYSKQTLQIEPNMPIRMGPGEIGTGAKATEVTRAYDDFINEQVNLKNSQYYYWKAESDSLSEIETIVNETDAYGLNQTMSEFWSAWADLANNPDGIPEREALLAKSNNLVQCIQSMDDNLREYQMHLDSTIRGSVDQVNSIIEQIGDLNNQISGIEVEGVINANDLRDKRDLLLGELSEYMDISYYEEESSGQVMVYILGGTPLVLGTSTYDITAERNVATGNTDLMWNDVSGRQINITHKLEGGKIAGWVDVRDTRIGSYLDSLNTLTEELTWQVNALHSEGVGLSSVTSMVGTVDISADTDDLGADFIFSDRYNSTGTFDIVAYDASGNVVSTSTINPAGDTVADLMAEINTAAGTYVTASLTGGTSGNFQILADGAYTFVIKPTGTTESSNALAIMGVNSFFSWGETSGATPDNDITETLGINSALTANSGLIAAGALDSDSNIAEGSNDVALAISDLQNTVITDIGGAGISTTMDSYYSAFIAEVGVDVQNAVSNEKYNDTLLSQYIQRKESITGVNLDEEMVDVLRFQRLYQAAAKIIAVCDEMMQSLLSTK